MRKILFILLLSVQFSANAQDIILPELEGFKKQTNYPVFTPENLWDFINGAADTYLSYGFVNLHVAEYKKGKNVIKLEVYQHSDNTLAFGIYSAERSPSFEFMNLGAQGYAADGSINFFKGKYYVKIRTWSEKEKILQSARSLAQNVAELLPGETQMPAVISRFPAEGKKLNEETYINESVLGHSFLNNAFRANYEIGDESFSVFILEKGSAKEALNTVNAYLKITKMDQTDEEAGKYVLQDGYNETIFLSWNNERVVIISGLGKDKSETAAKYTTEIMKK